MINESDAEYRKDLGDKDDRQTYKKFMKQGGKRAFERHQHDKGDDKEEYKNRMKFGKHGK